MNLLLLLALLLSGFCLRADEVSLVRVGEVWSLWRGYAEPAATWREPGFGDHDWETGPSGFSYGYGIFDEAVTLSDMPWSYNSIYLRKTFALTNVAAVKWLVFRADYAGGFVASLNGQEIIRRGFEGPPGRFVPAKEPAIGGHARGTAEDVDITAFAGLLREGDNVLAIQAHNGGAGSFTFAMVPELLANFTRGPFIQNSTPSGFQVIWRTPLPADTTMEYGLTPALGAMIQVTNLATNHVVTLTNLAPGAKYFYRASSESSGKRAVASIQSTRTLKTSGDLRFAVFGDSGSGGVGQYRIAEVLRSVEPDLVLHTGDVIYPEFTTGRVDLKCLSVYGPQMRNVPYYFTIGNHDLYAGPGHYFEAFYLPTNTVTGQEDFYSFDHGDAHFTVLVIPYLSQYSPRIGDPQHLWLEADLAASRKPWKFILMHNPMQTSSAHRFDDQNFNGIPDRFEVRDFVLPLAAKHGVQVVFSGHEHCFERFAPTNGVHQIVTGGGGIILYSLVQMDAASAQYWPVFHATLATVSGDTLNLSAVDQFGNTFDALTIQRAPPAPVIHEATRNSPLVENSPGNDMDGNITGQTYNMTGEAVPARSGLFSNLGRLQVNNDATNLYVGLKEVMITADTDILLFIESPALTGVPAMRGLGNGVIDPEGQGVDALDFLKNLSFTNFAPAIACVLGDEFGDGQYRNFARPAGGWKSGQGVFRLDTGFGDIPGVRLQQFNRSPQRNLVAGEQNADFIEIVIPLKELGNPRPGDIIKVGAVAGAGSFVGTATGPARMLDTGFLGVALNGSGAGPVSLEGASFRLAFKPGDRDEDGMSDEDELAAGTDPLDARSVLRISLGKETDGRRRVSWPAVIGKKYVLETAPLPFDQAPATAVAGFPRTATSTAEFYEEAPLAADGLNPSRFYRVRVLP